MMDLNSLREIQKQVSRRIVKMLLLLACCHPLYAGGINDGPSIDRIIEDYNKIETISAGIAQQVYLPGGRIEYYSGDYRADNKGNLRIDYYHPTREIVINNSSGFYWYFPDKKTVYYKKGKLEQGEFFNPSPGKIIEENSSDIKVTYEGKEFYGFFNRAAVFSITSSRNPTVIKIWTDTDGLYVLRKYVYDSNGRELVREIYSDHVQTGGVYIPSSIELFMWTSKGTVHTYTRYSNICINIELPGDIFVFKKNSDLEFRKLDEM